MNISLKEIEGKNFVKCGLCGGWFSKHGVNNHLSRKHPEYYKKYLQNVIEYIEEGIDCDIEIYKGDNKR